MKRGGERNETFLLAKRFTKNGSEKKTEKNIINLDKIYLVSYKKVR